MRVVCPRKVEHTLTGLLPFQIEHIVINHLWQLYRNTLLAAHRCCKIIKLREVNAISDLQVMTRLQELKYVTCARLCQWPMD